MTDTTSTSRAEAAARALPLAALLAIALLALAWNDVLPGGYRLRKLVESEGVREARARALHAAARMQAFAIENETAPAGSIVFLGSSTIERFPLAESFPGKPCLNRGIASESALELLRRVPGRLPRARPAGIVVYTGAMDWREEGRTTLQVVERVARVLARIAEGAPGVPIALLGILPERDMEPSEVARLSETNGALADLAKSRGASFVSTAEAPITSRGGSLSEEVSQDEFHLDAQGYRHLARRILEDGGEVGRRLSP